MEVNPQRLREIIKRVIAKYRGGEDAGSPKAPLVPEGSRPLEKIKAYAVCEKGKSAEFLAFLRACKASGTYALTVVPECPDRELIAALLSEGLCDGFAAMEAMVDPAIAFSIYPTFARSSLAEAAMGMDYGFAAKCVRRDFESGRKILLRADGLDPFTGREPEAYKELIVSHIRNLIQMGISFFRTQEELLKTLGGEAPKAPAKQAPRKAVSIAPAAVEGTGRFDLRIEGNLVFAKDLKKIPKGSTVVLSSDKVITPLAKDQIRDRRLKIVFA